MLTLTYESSLIHFTFFSLLVLNEKFIQTKPYYVLRSYNGVQNSIDLKYTPDNGIQLDSIDFKLCSKQEGL